jgi:hypothetical protein
MALCRHNDPLWKLLASWHSATGQNRSLYLITVENKRFLYLSQVFRNPYPIVKRNVESECVASSCIFHVKPDLLFFSWHNSYLSINIFFCLLINNLYELSQKCYHGFITWNICSFWHLCVFLSPQSVSVVSISAVNINKDNWNFNRKIW